MDPRKPSELIPFLRKRELLPKKSLSQNFLVDPNVLKKIVEVASVKEGETILEIGPGPGCLTRALLEKNCKVIAVEKDQRFVSLLGEIFSNEQHLSVIHHDFLTYSITEPVKVVANIPYHITAPILEHLADFLPLLSSVILVVQKDV